MEPPILKLTMVQGPREGETLEFRPGSTVRIGRVVRGNNVTIKDAGVSSKHLVIVSESGKWSLQDLDSSNGTTLNSSILSPYKSFDLRDGDTIKLGESTSILVQFNVHEETSQLRRNPRRRVKETSKVGSVAANRSRRGIEEEKENDENSEEENVEKFEVKSEVIVPESRGRGRPRRAKALEKKLDSVVPAETKRVNLRSTRSRKNEDCVVLENLGAGCGELGKKVRGGRGRKKNLQEVPAENVQCDVVDVKEKVDLGINIQEEVKEVANGVKVETVEDVHEEITEKEMDFGEKCNDTAKGNDTKEDDVSEAQVGANKSSEKGKELPDLEKMTLEEWFNSMEVDLPNQILEVTEEIVEGMRRKAERVQEYMIEQKKKQGVGNGIYLADKVRRVHVDVLVLISPVYNIVSRLKIANKDDQGLTYLANFYIGMLQVATSKASRNPSLTLVVYTTLILPVASFRLRK
ncbi:hypothetical protein SADUNF_Sadunf10G0034700 [Salix dunnii]|uniref:FHA domain-containing protein n=1 Tax=Salix dunnii TaxID=1413687 RepID=A0A835JS09_9ROSI|nr:hypothetical protein SADUNF_Sadunf10G0034700 [Salix dunnii]